MENYNKKIIWRRKIEESFNTYHKCYKSEKLLSAETFERNRATMISIKL